MTSNVLYEPSSAFRLKACASGIASVILLLSGNAQAQTGADGAEIQEIVTTGSRIARDGYSAPTPVSVLTEEEINADAPGSVAEFVMALPSVQGSSTGSTNSGSVSPGGAGISALNLRELGAGRTLVLFDGQRSVVSAGTGLVDTNTFPQPLVSRVEVVTGGASSTYGSDAISGVINFILDKDYTGIKTSAEYGESSEGDNAITKFTFTGGTPFADGRGHVLFSTESYQKDGIHYTARDWARNGYFAIVNPDRSEGAPHFYLGENIGISAYSPGGIINSGPLQGTYFGEGGSINQLEYGEVSGQWMVGGDWQYPGSIMLGSNSLTSDDHRESVFGRVSYELDGGVEVYAQASWAEYEGYSFYVQPTDRAVSIQSDNAFLPDEIVQQMAANGIDSFTMGTNNGDMPASGSNNIRETQRFVLGANGNLLAFNREFNWDAYYQRGVTDTDEHLTETYNFANLALATDAVRHPDTNEIVCRSALSDPASDCVPLNRFGLGVASAEALDYVLGRPRRQQEFQQDVAAVNFTTNELVEGWAGPVSLAFGAEYREDSIDGKVDPIYNDGWKYGNYKVTAGSYDVAEVYVETVIPLMDRLEFQGAVRYTDYSTSGAVTTWKGGFTFNPVDDVTLRLTRSLDIRAPNLEELYATGTGRTNNVSINGVSTQFVQSLQGSTDIMPEEADALGFGVVYQPGFIPGLAVSADYYDIEIDGVIGALSAEQTVEFCFEDGIQAFCDNMNYDADGVLQTIDLYYANLNSMKARGVDYEASYTFGLDRLFGRAAGDIRLRAMATNYIDNITDNNVRATNMAGVHSGFNSTADWVYRLTATYTVDSWMASLAARGVSDGVISNDYIECSSNCPESQAPYYTINDNSVPGEVYFDAYASRNLSLGNADSEVFLSVKNVLDTDPVLTGSPVWYGAEHTAAYPPTNRNLYDTMGRNIRLGVRVNF